MTEVEIRGKLTKKEFDRLKSFLDKKAELKDNYKRLSVDISPGFDPETRTWKDLKNSTFDLRLKKSRGSEKISLKVGEFHLKECEEIEVKLKEGQFLEALNMFETLGFDKGMIYFWKSLEYEYESFEIKVSKYTDNYYTWEIESDNPEKDPNELAKTLSLKPYTKEEYRKAINWENQNIHELYSFELVKGLLKK